MSKNIVQIHKWQMVTPDYLMIDLKSKGGAATPTRGDGRLIVYGITGTHNDVSSSVLDTPYVVENGKMVMETDLDLNGKRLLNHNPKSKTVILGKYNKTSGEMFTINDSNIFKFGFDFTIKKITFNVKHRTGVVNAANTRLRVHTIGREQTASVVINANDSLIFSFDFAVSAHETFGVRFQGVRNIVIADVAILIEI